MIPPRLIPVLLILATLLLAAGCAEQAAPTPVSETVATPIPPMNDRDLAEQSVADAQEQIQKTDSVITWFRADGRTSYDAYLPSIIAKRETALSYLTDAIDEISNGNYSQAQIHAQDAHTKANESYHDALEQKQAAEFELQGFSNLTHPLPEEKYVFLSHDIRTEAVPIWETCFHPKIDPDAPFKFDSINGMLTVYSSDYGNESVNESLIAVYHEQPPHYYGSQVDFLQGDGLFMYSLPAYSLPGRYSLYPENVTLVPSGFSENVTLLSVTRNGTVSLRYKNTSIVLKPKERWQNITRSIRSGETLEKPGVPSTKCEEEIIATDTLYNAGVFDKKNIVVVKISEK
jgi:hypothetical protein